MNVAESSYVEAARQRKADKLADFIVTRYRESFADKMDVETFIDAVAQMSNEWWKDTAHQANVRMPSQDTQNLVLSLLRIQHEQELEQSEDASRVPDPGDGRPAPVPQQPASTAHVGPSAGTSPKASASSSRRTGPSDSPPSQGDLFSSPGKFHHNAGATEVAGALSVAGKKDVQKQRILQVLRMHPMFGAIRSEIEEKCNLLTQSATGRLKELEEEGLITKTRETRISSSTGRKQTVYRLASSEVAS